MLDPKYAFSVFPGALGMKEKILRAQTVMNILAFSVFPTLFVDSWSFIILEAIIAGVVIFSFMIETVKAMELLWTIVQGEENRNFKVFITSWIFTIHLIFNLNFTLLKCMGAIWWGTRGTCSPTFSDGVDIICYVPPLFSLGVCIWRDFKTKYDVCHVLCEEFFMLDVTHRQWQGPDGLVVALFKEPQHYKQATFARSIHRYFCRTTKLSLSGLSPPRKKWGSLNPCGPPGSATYEPT